MNYFKIKFKNELNKNKGFTLRNSKGFTLVETLISLFIFTIALLVMINLSAESVINVSYAKNKLTATYLAVDGLEYMRNTRDNCVLFEGSQCSWAVFKEQLKQRCVDEGPCYFDTFKTDNFQFPYDIAGQDFFGINSCGESGCSNFYNNEGEYNYEQGNNVSRFKREVTIEDLGEDEIKITSTVYWTSGSKTFNVSFSDYLRSWNVPIVVPPLP